MVTLNNSKSALHLSDQGISGSDWLASIGQQFSPQEKDQFLSVLTLVRGVVEHQQNIVGDTDVQHALNVVEILASINSGFQSMLATLLYSLLQTCVLSVDEIRVEYGQAIAEMVDNISRLKIIEVHHLHTADLSTDHRQLESVRKLLLALADDIRVVIIKLAERLYLMRHIKRLPRQLQRQFSFETRDIYAPLANRLGIWQLKWELEDLSFRYIDPPTYQRIASLLVEKRVDREQFISSVVETLRREVDKAGIAADINGRPKHIYSIWRKMSKKDVLFDDLYDVRATRVLVKDVASCYAVLGIVHNIWRPIKEEFDDYIALPKENNYQSLHTAVLGPNNKTLEVQIRTKDMHEQSEYGDASHWRYKEGGKQDSKYQQKIAWLRRLLEWKDDSAADTDLFEHFKTELFDERVYVLTPQGKVIDLPSGATTLDFAYHIHTQVGHHYRGAKVDGRIVSMGYRIENGQQIEILTSKQAKPSRDWLNKSLGYADCSRTRAKIRNWFRQQDYQINFSDGQILLHQELTRLGLKHIDSEKLLKKFNYRKFDDLLAGLGRGDISTIQIAGAVSEHVLPTNSSIKNVEAIARAKKSKGAISATAEVSISIDPDHHITQRLHDGIKVMGIGDMLVKTAGCCKPVPFDGISGYITRGRGVTIHREDCTNILRLKAVEQERIIEVSWGEAPANTYPVDIFINAFDRAGLLHDISNIFIKEKLNVSAVTTQSHPKTSSADMSFCVDVADAVQLSRALTKIEHLPNVRKVVRK